MSNSIDDKLCLFKESYNVYKNFKDTLISAKQAKEDPNVDKYKFEFSRSSDNPLVQISLFLNGYQGVYGSSSAYSLGGGIDNPRVVDSFVFAVNKNIETITKDMLEHLKSEVQGHKSLVKRVSSKLDEMIQEVEKSDNSIGAK